MTLSRKRREQEGSSLLSVCLATKTSIVQTPTLIGKQLLWVLPAAVAPTCDVASVQVHVSLGDNY